MTTVMRGLDRLDALLARVTMYRFVIGVLLALVAVYVVFTATGVIEGLSTGANLAALVVLVVASDLSNRVLGRVVGVRPHAESALVTALLLFFLFVPLPTSSIADFAWLAATAALAHASKYVIAWRGRHLLNPAAAGAVLVVLAQWAVGRDGTINAVWQTAASEPMLPFVAVGALLVLWRTRRTAVGLTCVAVAGVLVVAALTLELGMSTGDAVRLAATSYPLVFLAGFMLTEPLTLPPRRPQQLAVATVVGVLLALPTAAVLIDWTVPTLGPLSLTPEVALVLGNLLAFGFARRTGIELEVARVRPLGGDTVEVAFSPRRPVAFRAGQYLELHLPHAGADGRGVRRVLSISSPPGAERLTVAVRVPQDGSTFKQALTGLAPGDRVHATGVHGDFVWDRRGRGSRRPLLLVAGGIGITPFMSQLRSRDPRDTVLVYGVSDGDAIAYRDELVAAGVRVVLVCPEPPADLPDSWQHVVAPALTPEVVADAAPDHRSRLAYLSGPPAMVTALRRGLRSRVAGVRTDAFVGY